MSDSLMEIHDKVLTSSINRKEEIIDFLTSNFNISKAQMNEDSIIREILIQLVREENAIALQIIDDIAIYLSEDLADLVDIPLEVSNNLSTKNSFYNRAEAKKYINRYWNNYNSAYPNFSSGGGDCANFISQVLHAGGMPFIYDGIPSHYTWSTNWYCQRGATNKDNDKRISLSWKVASMFRSHWEKRAYKHMIYSSADALREIRSIGEMVNVGDPVQYCYANSVPWHTLVVTDKLYDRQNNVKDILLASHSYDSNSRSLYNALEVFPTDYKIRFYIIKKGK